MTSDIWVLGRPRALIPPPPPDFAGKGIEAAPGPLQRSDPAKRGSGHWSPLVVFAVVRAVGATPSSWGGTLQRQGCWGKRIWGGQGQGGGGTGNGGVEGWGDEGSNQCQSQSLFKRGTLHYQLPTTNVYLVVNKTHVSKSLPQTENAHFCGTRRGFNLSNACGWKTHPRRTQEADSDFNWLWLCPLTQLCQWHTYQYINALLRLLLQVAMEKEEETKFMPNSNSN